MDFLRKPRFTSLENWSKERHSVWSKLSKPRFTSLENVTKEHHSVWSIEVNQDLLPLKTGLRDITLYGLFQLARFNSLEKQDKGTSPCI